MSTVDIRPFEDADAEAVARLSTTVQWPSLTDPDVVRRCARRPARRRTSPARTARWWAGPRRSGTGCSSPT